MGVVSGCVEPELLELGTLSECESAKASYLSGEGDNLYTEYYILGVIQACVNQLPE